MFKLYRYINDKKNPFICNNPCYPRSIRQTNTKCKNKKQPYYPTACPEKYSMHWNFTGFELLGSWERSKN
jgi:hypothetical protein